MDATQFTALLSELGACSSARQWAQGKDLKTVWETCDRGDWMLWLANKMQGKPGWGDLKNRTAAKVKCARMVQHLMKDKRSLHALDVAEAFSRGEATLAEMNAAAYAAYAAAYDDAYDDAYAAAAYDDDARTKVLAACADICRETLITPLSK